MATFDKLKSVYPHFFAGRISFLEADRFAHLYDPEQAATDRILAIIIDHFIGTGSIVISGVEINFVTWKNFGVPCTETQPALVRLQELQIVSHEGNLFGLTRLIEAERSIAKILLSNEPVELSEEAGRSFNG